MSDSSPLGGYYNQEDEAKKVEQLTRDSARRQFFKALYDRDYDLVKLLLTGSRRKYVHANLICLEDRWTALHACLYKYNQYPPDETLRIVQLLLDHNSDVNKACPEGAVGTFFFVFVSFFCFHFSLHSNFSQFRMFSFVLCFNFSFFICILFSF